MFPATTWTFTNDTALSEQGRGAAWCVWINARHGRATAWARHAMCESAFTGWPLTSFIITRLYLLIIRRMFFNIIFIFVSFLCFYVFFVYSAFLCCFVYCFSFVYSCLFPIFVQVYWLLPPGGNPIAVNIISYIISHHTIYHIIWLQVVIVQQTLLTFLNMGS
jgi:hypothetical protein